MDATPYPFTGLRRAPRPVAASGQELGLRGRSMYNPHTGEHVEVVYIGGFAAVLGTSTATIRRWERDGTLPESPFEELVRNGPARRLYALPWVAGVLRIAEAESEGWPAGSRPVSTPTTSRLEHANSTASCSADAMAPACHCLAAWRSHSERVHH
jgi:hypothetical protein